MKLLKVWSSATLTIIVILLVGCSGNGTPVLQDTRQSVEREASLFPQTGLTTIFPTSTTQNDVYHDVDTSVIRDDDDTVLAVQNTAFSSSMRSTGGVEPG